METKGKHQHRGALLEAVVNERHVNITQMVKRMGISRGTYYNHIHEAELSYERLQEYGKVIGYDFSVHLPGMKRFVVEEPEAVYKIPKTLEEAIEQRDYWRERYYQMVEKHNLLLEEIRRASPLPGGENPG